MTGLAWTPKPVEIPGSELEYLGPYGLVSVRQLPLITVGTGWYEDLRVVARNGRRRNAITIPGHGAGIKPPSTGLKFPPEPLTNAEALALLDVIPQRTITGVRNRSLLGSDSACNPVEFGAHRAAPRCVNTRGHGTEGVSPMQRKRTDRTPAPWQARFWRYVSPGQPDACWEWTGSRDQHGYGRINLGRGVGHLKSHRASYLIHHGPIPDGLNVLHSCDNPPCCNPAHLSAGTHKDNTQDMLAKGRQVAPTGDGNGKTVYTDAVIREIREAAAAGESYDALAERFGLTSKYICAVVLGRRRAAAGGRIRV